MRSEVLSVEQMYQADRLAMAGGVSGRALMEAAGFAVAQELMRRFPACRVLVLCGPGNNGGDGFVAARLLERRGYAVTLALFADRSRLYGDAAAMADLWRWPVVDWSPALLDRADVVVDALFGAGLARDLDGAAAEAALLVGERGIPVVAVDVPSGIDGDTGAVRGRAFAARVTVTFFRQKPAHLLLPGRLHCGEVVVADIGIPAAILDDIAPAVAENGPDLWLDSYPWPQADGHKYARGHVVVVGGAEMTGAARLAARAARRAGAGLATIAAPPPAVAVHRTGDPGTIVAGLDQFQAMLADSRRNVWVLGPGGGRDEPMRRHVHEVLAAGRSAVLDADALTVFSGKADALFRSVTADVLLTPHDGEFVRLFGQLPGSRLDRAREAAKRAGAVVLLKGPDTVVAHPDGRAVINANAPPWLATAGAGDVLAGLAAALMAAGMSCFDAACAACWLHGAAAQKIGPGLIAEDLCEALPGLLAELAVWRIAPEATT